MLEGFASGRVAKSLIVLVSCSLRQCVGLLDFGILIDVLLFLGN